MDVVPTLKQFSLLSLIECLINEKCPCRVMKIQWLKLIRQLDQGSWGDASKCLLDRMVIFYSRKVTQTILEALLPINAKDLHLTKCPLVTEDCINKIMNRCTDLKSLNLTKNPHFKFNKLDLFNNKFKINCKLTTVVLKGCPQVNDLNIKALLKNAPLLVSLNMSFCNISDKAFIFNGVPSDFNQYGCKLETIDLSFCEKFSNTGVHHLCSLCGSTLQSIDLFKTKVDCIALLHLSGIGRDAAKQLLNSLRQDSQVDTLEQTDTSFKPNIRNLISQDLIFQAQQRGLLCFKQFLRANRDVSSLKFYCLSRSENCITDDVLKLIGDHAHNLKSLTVVRGLHMTTSGITALAQCKQLTYIELMESDTIEDSAIIELVQNLNLSHIKLMITSVTSASLNAIAAKNMLDLLRELGISWCDHLEYDSEGLHNVIKMCRSLEKLHMTNCCVSTTTLKLLAGHCHNITELIINCSSGDFSDASFILLSKNVRLLEKINMGGFSGLTDKSIKALLTNCKRLKYIYLDRLGVTSEPFLQLISVPGELKTFLTDKVNEFLADNLKKKIRPRKVNLRDFNIEMSELPCLPNRSMVYCTDLKKMYIFDYPLVEEEKLQILAAVTQGSLKIASNESVDVKGGVSSLKRFIQAQIIIILEEVPGFEKNYTIFIPGYFEWILQKLGHLFRIFEQCIYWLLLKLGF